MQISPSMKGISYASDRSSVSYHGFKGPDARAEGAYIDEGADTVVADWSQLGNGKWNVSDRDSDKNLQVGFERQENGSTHLVVTNKYVDPTFPNSNYGGDTRFSVPVIIHDNGLLGDGTMCSKADKIDSVTIEQREGGGLLVTPHSASGVWADSLGFLVADGGVRANEPSM